MIKMMNSLRFKLIFVFLVITLLMGAISIGTFLTLRRSMSQLDEMVDTTLLANGISNSAVEVATFVAKYMVSKNDDDKKKFTDALKLFEKI